MENNLTQNTLTIEQEQEQALQFLMENELYGKFLMWMEIQEEIKKNAEKINAEEIDFEEII